VKFQDRGRSQAGDDMSSNTPAAWPACAQAALGAPWSSSATPGDSFTYADGSLRMVVETEEDITPAGVPRYL